MLDKLAQGPLDRPVIQNVVITVPGIGHDIEAESEVYAVNIGDGRHRVRCSALGRSLTSMGAVILFEVTASWPPEQAPAAPISAVPPAPSAH